MFGVLLCATLPLHRRCPAGMLAAVCAVAFAQWLFSVPQLGDAAVLLGLYWVARESRIAYVLLGVVIVETGAVLAAVRWGPLDPSKTWVGLTGLAVAAAASGITIRQRRTLLESLQQRAAQLEIERDEEGRVSAAAERTRIAREMHDIVSHNLTVMIALADGATYEMGPESGRALPAVERISTTGRQALHEMRRLLGVLRDEPSSQPLEPQPSLARLDELLSQVEAAGIPVSVVIEGDPSSLSEGAQLTVFRVAQEALTNTLKHAVDPQSARLVLRCAAGTVKLDVSDDGRILTPTDKTREGRGGVGPATVGKGILGMRERAAAYGGDLEAGPLPDGGWCVRLRISA